jgi:hypothetical protein
MQDKRRYVRANFLNDHCPIEEENRKNFGNKAVQFISIYETSA